MIRKVLIGISDILCSLFGFSQFTPQWLFSATRSTVTNHFCFSSDTAIIEDSALKNAFVIGMAVDVDKLESTAEDRMNFALSKFVNIPINAVCKYVKPLIKQTGYRAHVLFSVAKDARKLPDYWALNCFLNKVEE